MKVRIVGISLLSVALQAPLSALELTLAPGGDDAGPGTIAQPLATPLGAQQRARMAIVAGERRVVVHVRPGIWYLTAPLVLTATDIPPGGDTRWEGEQGAVFSAGLPLRSWQAAGATRWRAGVPADVRLSALWSAFTPVAPTRWPTTGWAHLTACGSRWAMTPKPPRGTGLATVLHAWGAGRCAVSVVEGSVLPAASLAWAPVPELAPVPGRPLMIEGLVEPGVNPGWRRESPDSVVLAAATAPVDNLLVVDRLPAVMRVMGTSAEPVRRLTISGLTFAHAAWPVPEGGVVGVQAGHVVEAAAIGAAPAALELAWTEDCAFDNLRVVACAGGGIALGAGCARVRLSRCVVEDVGATGIMVGWRGRTIASLGADWATTAEVPRAVAIERCRISRAGGRDPGAVGIAVLFAREAKLTGNLVEDLPYSGISLGFRWDTSATSQRGAQVDSNHIRRVMRLLTDGGGIYTLGWQPGARIRGNLIEDVGCESPVEGAPSGGLFFDNGSKGLAVEGNVLARIIGEPLRFNGCAPSWLLLGDNQVLTADQRVVPPGVAEGVGP